MKWSWRVGRFSGIDVFVHATFLLIIGWVGFSYWQQTRELGGTVEGILFTLILFGCVLLHEFGHALAARRYGIKTRDITLYPIGGIARLERMPEKPIQEFWVVISGPAVNLVISALLFLWLLISGTIGSGGSLSLAGGSFLERLMIVNLSLAAFNLIPAFPMDGGRIFRSLLAMRLEYVQATQIAAAVGQGLALILGIAGLFANPVLVFIAVFIWFGAGQEASMEKNKSDLEGILVSSAVITNFQKLSPNDPIERAVDLILTGSQRDFPVVLNDYLAGMVTRSDAFAALSRQQQQNPVYSIMRRDFPVVDANETLEKAFIRLQTTDLNTVPVTFQNKLVGLLTEENIREFLTVHSVLRKTGGQGKMYQPSAAYPRS